MYYSQPGTNSIYKIGVSGSLEVAEHLEPSSAGTIVQSLVSLSDVFLFSAAFPGQGRTNHINEQPHSYWATALVLDEIICHS